MFIPFISTQKPIFSLSFQIFKYLISKWMMQGSFNLTFLSLNNTQGKSWKYVKHKRGSCHYKLYNTSMYQSFPTPSCCANWRISLFIVYPDPMYSTYYSLIIYIFSISYYWFSIESNSSITIDKNEVFVQKKASKGFVTVMKP